MTSSDSRFVRTVSSLVAAVGLSVSSVTAATANVAPARAAQPAIVANDNRVAAGSLDRGGVRVSLVARRGLWYPDGPGTVGVPIGAFGEVGKPLHIPGPLLRVAAGTPVTIRLRNALPGETLHIHGLSNSAAGDIPIVIRSGAERVIHFRRDTPGTYGYWAADASESLATRFGRDAGLAGAIVVDDPHHPRPVDRVFVFNTWINVLEKDGSPNFVYELQTMNGRSWPATERLSYVRGTTIRWRVYNPSLESHAMHLHGFPFVVDAVGDGIHDESYLGRARPGEVTHRVAAGDTFALHWRADRAGDWMFHCHIAPHILKHAALTAMISGHAQPGYGALKRIHQTPDSMGGMIVAVRVVPAPGDAPLARPIAQHRLTLDVVDQTQPSEHGFPKGAFAYVVHDRGIAEPANGNLGPLIVLTQGEPTAITVTNQLAEPTTVHWHGMDVQRSYDDGAVGMTMPGASTSGASITGTSTTGASITEASMSGASMAGPPMARTAGARTSIDGRGMTMSHAAINTNMPRDAAPAIERGATFEARFTPLHAGTFMYHTHMDDTWQLLEGLAGPLIVLPPGKTFDPATDHIVMVSVYTEHPFGDQVLINGGLTPEPIVIHAMVPQRLRLINMTAVNADLVVSLDGVAGTTWTPIAKDGNDLDPRLQTARTPVQQLTIGETRDFRFTPAAVGNMTLDVFDGPARVGSIPIRIEP